MWSRAASQSAGGHARGAAGVSGVLEEVVGRGVADRATHPGRGRSLPPSDSGGRGCSWAPTAPIFDGGNVVRRARYHARRHTHALCRRFSDAYRDRPTRLGHESGDLMLNVRTAGAVLVASVIVFGAAGCEASSPHPAPSATTTSETPTVAPTTLAPTTPPPTTPPPTTSPPVTPAPVHTVDPTTPPPAPAYVAPVTHRAVAPAPVRTYAPPPPPPAPAPTHAAAAACHPLTNGGNCYEPGEFCRNVDHGASGVAGDGKAITCANNNGWRWEPA